MERPAKSKIKKTMMLLYSFSSMIVSATIPILLESNLSHALFCWEAQISRDNRYLTLGKNSKIKLGGSSDLTYNNLSSQGILYFNWGFCSCVLRILAAQNSKDKYLLLPLKILIYLLYLFIIQIFDKVEVFLIQNHIANEMN